MTALLLDAGALIALDRNQRDAWAMLRVAADGSLARAAGRLCGQASTLDVIDASMALVAAGISRGGDVAVTSDPNDMRHLLSALNLAARLVEI